MAIKQPGEGQVRRDPNREKKLTLDEQTFQQLLESAYVLQEENDRLAEENASPEAALAAVLEAQKHIQARRLGLAEAAEFIAQRIRAITNATGTASGIIEGSNLVYLAATGNASRESGSRLSLESSVSAPLLLSTSPLHGTILQCPDVNVSSDLNLRQCLALNIRSLIVVPVHYEDQIAGVLELRFDRPHAFSHRDVRIGELMASLLRDAIARAAEFQWKQSVIEKSAEASPPVFDLPHIDFISAPSASDPAGGTPAMPYSAELFPAGLHEPIFSSERHVAPPVDPDVAAIPLPGFDSDAQALPDHEPVSLDLYREKAPELATQTEAHTAAKVPWASASNTRQWLETLRPHGSWLSSQWRVHRANFYLAVSVILLLAVIGGWGTRSTRSAVSANGGIPTNPKPPQPELTLMERSLVALGLADPPQAPVYMGNPNTRVWIDLHTALYYCPGASLYGKTPGGKLSLQRDAQLDQFEAADRKVCD